MVLLSELIEWLKADEADSDLIEGLLETATVYVEEQTGMYYSTPSERTQTFAAGEWPLALRGTPDSGEDFTLERWAGTGWEAMDASSYYVDGEFVYMAGTIATAPVRMRATYTTGVPAGTAPKPLQLAVKMQVQRWYDGDTSEEGERAIATLLRIYRRATV